MTTLNASIDKMKAKQVIIHIANLMEEQEQARLAVKEAIDAQHENLGIEKSTLREMAKIYHKQNFTDVKNKADDLIDNYTAIMG